MRGNKIGRVDSGNGSMDEIKTIEGKLGKLNFYYGHGESKSTELTWLEPALRKVFIVTLVIFITGEVTARKSGGKKHREKRENEIKFTFFFPSSNNAPINVCHLKRSASPFHIKLDVLARLVDLKLCFQ